MTLPVMHSPIGHQRQGSAKPARKSTFLLHKGGGHIFGQHNDLVFPITKGGKNNAKNSFKKKAMHKNGAWTRKKGRGRGTFWGGSRKGKTQGKLHVPESNHANRSQEQAKGRESIFANRTQPLKTRRTGRQEDGGKGEVERNSRKAGKKW